MNSGALTVRAIALLLSLAGLALFARRLGPDGYAWFALAATIAAIFLSPLPRSLNATIARTSPDGDALDSTATVAVWSRAFLSGGVRPMVALMDRGSGLRKIAAIVAASANRA